MKAKRLHPRWDPPTQQLIRTLLPLQKYGHIQEIKGHLSRWRERRFEHWRAAVGSELFENDQYNDYDYHAEEKEEEEEDDDDDDDDDDDNDEKDKEETEEK